MKPLLHLALAGVLPTTAAAGKLVRSADDLPPGPPQDFKGASDCRVGRLRVIVWSM